MQYTNIQDESLNLWKWIPFILLLVFTLHHCYHVFQTLHFKKSALVGPPKDTVCTLVLSPKMKANENKFITEEGQPTWKSLLRSSSTIIFPPSSGSQWSETRHICSLQFELPGANLHWFTSFPWLNMNICFSETLGCSLFEHNLILQTCYKPINRGRGEDLTSQEILIVLHQVWGLHQRVVGAEGRLQFIPLWCPVPNDKNHLW